MTNPISYSTPTALPIAKGPRPGRAVVAAAVLCVVGLGLLAIAGCFLIGVLLVIFPQFDAPTGWQMNRTDKVLALSVLYGFSGVSLIGALTCLVLGVRRLIAQAAA